VSNLSGARQQIFGIISQSAVPMSAYDILAVMSKSKTTAPPTVYRALANLLEQGLVHRIETLNAYVACHHPHHVAASCFMICQTCSKIEETEMAQPITQWVHDESRMHAFRPQRLTFEISGVCAGCAEVPELHPGS